jgi:hypothetical protein
MPAHLFRHTIILLALAALPGFAAAAGSQAGDNGRMPIGADNEGPRQAIPNAMTNDGSYYTYDGSRYYYVDPYYGTRHYEPWSPYYAPPATSYYAPPTTYYVPAPSYYVAPSYYGPTYWGYWGPTYSDQRDLRDAFALCDARPLTERAACRDAVYGR